LVENEKLCALASLREKKEQEISINKNLMNLNILMVEKKKF